MPFSQLIGNVCNLLRLRSTSICPSRSPKSGAFASCSLARIRPDPPRAVPHFSEDIADHVVPLISRDPDSVKFLRCPWRRELARFGRAADAACVVKFIGISPPNAGCSNS